MRDLLISVLVFLLTPIAALNAPPPTGSGASYRSPSPSAAAHYGHHGAAALPDPSLTPGEARPDATRQQLCSAGFTTKKYRHTTAAEKSAAYAEYGATKKTGVCCEVDHLISLELGGADTPKNLWPQPYEPRPGAHEKDQVENWLHRQVCDGAWTLEKAQREISRDWYAVYLEMQLQEKSR